MKRKIKDIVKDKKVLFLIILGIIVFSIRLLNINEAIYDDESNFADSVSNANNFGFNEKYYSPLFFNWIEIFFISLFGVKTWVFRLVPWLFGIANTILVYYFAKRNYDRRTAFFSVLLMLFAFYPTLASLQFDVEGNFVMFSILLMFFSYLEYERTGKLGWQVLAGIALGTTVVNKYNAVHVVMTLGLYVLIKSRFDIFKTIKNVFWVYAIGFSIFIFYLILAMVSSPNWWDFVSIIGLGRYSGPAVGWMSLPMFILWSTPLLFGFYVLGLCKWKKENTLILLWVTVNIFFYIFIIKSGSFDRYFMNTIPAMAVLGGHFLSTIRLERKHLLAGVIVLLLSVGALFLVNALDYEYIARLPGLYINKLLDFNINFLFVYTSASGPTFGINFAALFISYTVSFFSLFLFMISDTLSLLKSKSKYLFIVFLAVSLAYNVFLTSEYLFDIQGPDVSKVQHDMVKYFFENDMPYPVYTNDQGMQFYVDPTYWHNETKSMGFSDNEVDSPSFKTMEKIKNEGGTILFLRWPPIPENSPAWDVVNLCSKNESFYPGRVLLGEVYRCESMNISNQYKTRKNFI